MDLEKNIPKYLVDKQNLIRLVVFTAAFSLLFINVYQPYESRGWMNEIQYSGMGYFLLSSLLVLLGMCVVAISRVLMYKHCKRRGETIPYWAYSLWIAAEIVVMAAVFVVLELLLGFRDGHGVGELLKVSFANTAWIMFIPYSVLTLYFSWRDKDRRLKAINDYRMAREALAAGDLSDKMIIFRDTKGEIKLTVKTEDLIYIKGADNYITIHYNDADHVGTSMVRCTFKSVEAPLKEKGVVRCHRSYMVNKRHIKMFEKGKDGFALRMDTAQPTVIPVSKNYVADIYELFD